MIRRAISLLLLSAGIIAVGLGLSGGLRAVIESTSENGNRDVPTTVVRRGDVMITVSARGELQGGGAESLVAPRAGGAAELAIIYLRETGELIEAGDIVAEFDGSGQEYNLVEAEADLEEARQELLKAEAEARIALEEARLNVATAEADLMIAQLTQRGNELLPRVEQRQNAIALERAENHYDQAVEDLERKEATSGSGLASRQATLNEARTRAETARQTMANMTLRAGTPGYVEVAENSSGLSIIYSNTVIPTLQIGDVARPGQVVARIPDMSRWEVNAQIPETDRAYLEVGQEASVRAKAMPGQEFAGHVRVLGGSSGYAWNRSFNLRVALDETHPDLRPGMSVDLTVRVETLPDVLWIPSQAAFDSEGRWFVYVKDPAGYVRQNITVVRRTDSQAVVTGIDEGTTIALARPGQESGDATTTSGPLGALPQ